MKITDNHKVIKINFLKFKIIFKEIRAKIKIVLLEDLSICGGSIKGPSFRILGLET